MGPVNKLNVWFAVLFCVLMVAAQTFFSPVDSDRNWLILGLLIAAGLALSVWYARLARVKPELWTSASTKRPTPLSNSILVLWVCFSAYLLYFFWGASRSRTLREVIVAVAVAVLPLTYYLRLRYGLRLVVALALAMVGALAVTAVVDNVIHGFH